MESSIDQQLSSTAFCRTGKVASKDSWQVQCWRWGKCEVAQVPHCVHSLFTHYPLICRSPWQTCVLCHRFIMQTGMMLLCNRICNWREKLVRCHGSPLQFNVSFRISLKWGHYSMKSGRHQLPCIHNTGVFFKGGNYTLLWKLLLCCVCYRFKVDMSAYPTISRIHAALSELEAFKKADPSQQPDCPPSWTVTMISF